MVERGISFSMLKDLFALATVTGVVRRILLCPFFEGPLQLDGMGAVAPSAREVENFVFRCRFANVYMNRLDLSV